MTIHDRRTYEAEGAAAGGGTDAGTSAGSVSRDPNVVTPTPDPMAVAAAQAAAEKATTDAAALAATATPDPLAADKLAADKLAADKLAADKLAADKSKVDGAPEAYEFVLPEGMLLDQAQVDAFTPIAKELGLSNAAAQKLVDFQATFVKAQAAQWDAQVATWEGDVKAKWGQKFDENTGLVAKALDKFGSPGIRKALDSGMGSHPDITETFLAVGRAMSEDTFTSGNLGGGDTPVSAAQRLFPGFNP